jgi:hypothetical protein
VKSIVATVATCGTREAYRTAAVMKGTWKWEPRKVSSALSMVQARLLSQLLHSFAMFEVYVVARSMLLPLKAAVFVVAC